MAAHISEILARISSPLSAWPATITTPVWFEDEAGIVHYDRLMAVEDDEWREKAACKGLGDIFYPEDDHGRRGSLYDEARKVCATCEVTAECAEAGKREHHGLWGGKSPSERFPKRRRLGAS
jgi:hypothetical protein